MVWLLKVNDCDQRADYTSSAPTDAFSPASSDIGTFVAARY